MFLKTSPFIFFFFLLEGILVYSGCRHSSEQNQQVISDSVVSKGKWLAGVYCQSCHQLPDPSLLDKNTWIHSVLPAMGPRLGVFKFKNHIYPTQIDDINIGRKFYPARPMVTDQQWQDIIDYYWAVAPDSLKEIHRDGLIRSDTSLFLVKNPTIEVQTASTTMVRFDTTFNSGTILTSRLIHPGIYRYNASWQRIDSIASRGPIVDMITGKDESYACDIGYMNPNDSRLGSLFEIKNLPNGKKKQTVPLFDQLARPVQILRADLNNDHKDDFLICEFGNNLGSLSWLENTGEEKFIKHILHPSPGSIRAYVNDYNHDGLPDIWVLFAQGDECIMLFTNKGMGRFEEKKVLQFPAVNGSTYFEFDDFNGDGFPDILYCCGDNADYSPILKPYHGIYIFINDGEFHFSKRYFFPMYGCFKAIARDYDGDGDLDIAAISFFTDHTLHRKEGFVYLKNEGPLHFQPFTIPGLSNGKWLTMDAGDFYRSGKPDIILGNFNLRDTSSQNGMGKSTAYPFTILKNIMK